jgi:heme exporter protein D
MEMDVHTAQVSLSVKITVCKLLILSLQANGIPQKMRVLQQRMSHQARARKCGGGAKEATNGKL